MRCANCKISISGKYWSRDNKNYCPNCHENIRAKCSICKYNLSDKYYVIHSENVCLTCADTHNKCSVCDSYISHITNWGFRYSDERNICGLCEKSSIEKLGANNHYEKVSSFLTSIGFIFQSNHLPKILLVGKEELGNRVGYIRYNYYEKNFHNVYKDFEIRILCGLPEIIFLSILTHELFHMYCRLNAIEKLSNAEEEGLANLMQYLYLKSLIPRDKHEELLINHYKKAMLENTDPIYGQGFRDIKILYDNDGINSIFRLIYKKVIKIKS